jgi:hypothetical protein
MGAQKKEAQFTDHPMGVQAVFPRTRSLAPRTNTPAPHRVCTALIVEIFA